MKTRFSIIALALLAAGVAVAGEPRGVQRQEFVFYYLSDYDSSNPSEGPPVPVPCLGPDVYMEGTERVVVWSREYYSPDGTYHFMAQWRSEFEFHDQYGRTWIGSTAASVMDVMLGVAETHKYVAHLLFKPVLGDGAMWQMRNVGMIKVNADGKIVVDRPPLGTFDEVERCLPVRSKSK